MALIVAVCLLGALAVPAIDMHPASSGTNALPTDNPVRVAERRLDRAVPGAPSDTEAVVTGRGLDTRAAQARLHALGERAIDVTGGRGAVAVATARDGRTAVVSVPMPDRGIRRPSARSATCATRCRPRPNGSCPARRRS